MGLRKAGSNWVDGDRFFAREDELAALAGRVRDGTHTLLTGQRRMGKTSLVRELQRRLRDAGEFDCVFADVEGAADAADTVAEIALASMPLRGMRRRIESRLANFLRGTAVEELALGDVRIKLRAGIDAGSWRRRGDEVLTDLAGRDKPVILAIDELPILVGRILGDGGGDGITTEGRQAADAFLGWLRKIGQAYRGRIVLILSGSVSLCPILRRAGLSAHANVFVPWELEPWDEATAGACLAALAETYDIGLPARVRLEMCRKLRCQIPHHVQQYFDVLHEHLRRAGRSAATPEDADRVYHADLLGARGQIDLDHYETRVKTTLGSCGYRIALDLLTEASVGGGWLSGGAVGRFRGYYEDRKDRDEDRPVSVGDVLHQLEEDGYLERRDGGHGFVSGLLEDWWRARHGRHFVSIRQRQP